MWTIACWTRDRVATVDLSVRFTLGFKQLLLIVFLSIRCFLSSEQCTCVYFMFSVI